MSEHLSPCKECGQPAKWLAPRTSISTDDRGGLFAYLCDRHYRVLPIQRGRLLDPRSAKVERWLEDAHSAAQLEVEMKERAS